MLKDIYGMIMNSNVSLTNRRSGWLWTGNGEDIPQEYMNWRVTKIEPNHIYNDEDETIDELIIYIVK